MAKAADKYVLVVDDEEDVAFFLVTALEDAGFQAEAAHSVDEALARLEARPADLVSLDMVMPGKSGVVLFHELRKRPEWKRIPVLFVTGHARDERVKRDMDAAAALAESTLSGPATYLEKPVTAQTFVRRVAEILGVEGVGEASEKEESPEVLRRRLEELLARADGKTLQEVLQALEKSRRS